MAFIVPSLPYTSSYKSSLSRVTCSAAKPPSSTSKDAAHSRVNRATFLKLLTGTAATTALLHLSPVQAKDIFGLKLPDIPKVSIPEIKIPGIGGGAKKEEKKPLFQENNVPLQMSGEQGRQADDMLEKLRRKKEGKKERGMTSIVEPKPVAKPEPVVEQGAGTEAVEGE